MNRNERWQAVYEGLVYDPTEDPIVLKNIPDIRDFATLELFERESVKNRLVEGLPPKALEQSPEGLKAMHGHLFQDVYEWAGQYRTYPTARNPDASFALPEYISDLTDLTFRKFNAEGQLKGFKADDFADRAASYVNEINAIHPFIDGNGRIQRTWLRNTCENAGFSIDIKSDDQELWNKVSMMGMMTLDNEQTGYKADHPMRDFILSRMDWPSKERDQAKTQAVEQSLQKFEAVADRILAAQNHEQDNGGQER